MRKKKIGHIADWMNSVSCPSLDSGERITRQRINVPAEPRASPISPDWPGCVEVTVKGTESAGEG